MSLSVSSSSPSFEYIHGATSAGLAENKVIRSVFNIDFTDVIRPGDDTSISSIQYYPDVHDVGIGTSYGRHLICQKIHAGRLRFAILLCPAESGKKTIPHISDLVQSIANDEIRRLLITSAESPRSVQEMQDLRRNRIDPLNQEIHDALASNTKAEILVLESEDDPWRGTIEPHNRISVVTLKGNDHFPMFTNNIHRIVDASRKWMEERCILVPTATTSKFSTINPIASGSTSSIVALT